VNSLEDSYTAHINGAQVSPPSGSTVTDPPRGRPVAPWRRGLPWFLAALLVASIGIPSSAATMREIRVVPEIGYARPQASVTVTINLTDAPGYLPSYANVPEGSSVTFDLVNLGNYTHSFTLSKVPNYKISPALTPTQLNSFFAQNGSLANVSVAPHGTGSALVSFPATDALDYFEFVSVVPYQFQAGMFGFVNVTSTGPGEVIQEATINAPGFSPNELAANATHYPVVLNVLVTNQGTLSHTFTVVSQSNVTITPANFTSYFLAHPPLANVNVPAATGGTAWANFTVSAAGVYMYVCEIPGHFADGMFGFLYVGVPPPPPPPIPSTAIVQIWVLVGSGVLLGIGVLVALVANFSGRFPSRPKTPGHGHH
jgi:uncharacterized cupredoxin-like copper-binding protein